MLQRPTSRSIVTLTLVSMLGCDRKTEAAPKTTAAPGSSEVAADEVAADEGSAEGECGDARGAAIRAELTAACPIGEQTLKVDVPLAPWKSGPVAPPTDAFRLEVTTKGVSLGWDDPVPARELPDRITAEIEEARAYTGKARSWALAIAADAPRAEVATALQALVDGGHTTGHVLLATEDIGEIPPPPDPAVLAGLAAKIDEVDPSQRSTIMANEIMEKMLPCPGVEKAFQAVASAAPERRCPVLAAGIAEGLVACGCPDADVLLTQIYALTIGTKIPERLAVAVPVTIDPGASSRAGATWGAVVEGLDQAAFGTLWVAPG